MPPTDQLWLFLPLGYVLTVVIEAPVLLVGLSPRHSHRDRLVAAFGLTACTYPIVVLVLPLLLWNAYGRGVYLVVAETFAPVAECAIFWLLFDRSPPPPRRDLVRDIITIVLANLASFAVGELIYAAMLPA